MLPQQFKLGLDELARSGIFIGTSSWKYPGWCGQLYDEQRYLNRGKLSVAKFERECLAEYAQTFSTVCVDAGYYQFSIEKWIGGLCARVPEHFRFGFKGGRDCMLGDRVEKPRKSAFVMLFDWGSPHPSAGGTNAIDVLTDHILRCI